MNADDERLLRGRVYGHGHDDPNQARCLARRTPLWSAGTPAVPRRLDATER
ncbi:hypothetical protein [Streptomyces sp. NPDC005989]|uniref:hypothetical protein n=1 Tax=Streptomyces sp. NPDC005989 TaxID=3156727 RepID=UPI0033C47E5D